jgi:LysR family glycine cleavage system transcriptional activator
LRRFLFFSGIKAFEAAARTGSFAAAGRAARVGGRGQPDSAAVGERLAVALPER